MEVDGSRWNYIKVRGSFDRSGRRLFPAWPWKIPLCFHFVSTLGTSTGLYQLPNWKFPRTCMEASIYFQNNSTKSAWLRQIPFSLPSTSKTFIGLPVNFQSFYFCLHNFYFVSWMDALEVKWKYSGSFHTCTKYKKYCLRVIFNGPKRWFWRVVHIVGQLLRFSCVAKVLFTMLPRNTVINSPCRGVVLGQLAHFKHQQRSTSQRR